MATPIVASDVEGVATAFRGLQGCHLIDRDDPVEFRSAAESIATGTSTVDRAEARGRIDLYRNYGEVPGRVRPGSRRIGSQPHLESMSEINNVLLVTIDSLRIDTYCELRESVQSVGRVSNVVDVSAPDAYATGPGTKSSFPGMLTGTRPLSCGGLGPLTDDRPRLAEYLRDAGLATGGFQSNPFLSTHFNYDVGFDRFEDYQNPLMGVATRIFPRGIEVNNPKLRLIDDITNFTDHLKTLYQLVSGKPRPYVAAETISDDTIEWLRGQGDQFFCWAHYMDVHHPCFPPDEYRTRYGVKDVTQGAVSELYSQLIREPKTLTDAELDQLQRLYRASIDYTFVQVGRLLDTLEQQSVLDETLVLITSDHGELFGEHGEYGKPNKMYDELVNVPLLVINPPSQFADAHDELVSLLDVPPLVHQALCLTVPEAYEGRRFGTGTPREYVPFENVVGDDVVVGARSREWGYEVDEIENETRLTDHRDESDADAGDEDEQTSKLRAVVSERRDELDVTAADTSEHVDGDIEDRLSDLGYLE